MLKKIFQPKVLLFILLGAIIGAVLFTLGDSDDAPGLSFIGLSLAFLLIMRGIYHAGILRKGYHIPLVLLVFGVIALIFPFILYIDGEIQFVSLTTCISFLFSIVFLSIMFWRLQKVKKHRM